MEKDIVVIGSGHLAVGVIGALGLVGKSTVRPEGNWVEVPSFSGHPTDIPDTTRRISGVAKDRRLARKKRAKKVARRR